MKDRKDPVKIHGSKGKPASALDAVMFFFTPAETGGSENRPLIAIPAQQGHDASHLSMKTTSVENLHATQELL